MTQPFSFNNPNPAANPFGAPPAAGGFGGPPARPNPAAQALAELAGLSSSAIETRTQPLPDGAMCQVRIDAVRLVGSQDAGSLFFIEHEVLKSANDKVQVGAKHNVKISGFKGFKSQKLAMQDLKSFMCLALKDKGITPAWAGEGLDMSKYPGADPWGVLAVLMCEQNMAEGAVLNVQIHTWTPPAGQAGKPKLLANWYPAA